MNFDIDSIKFNSDGLVVAIAADALTNEVLMQAYMNREALEMTLKTGEAHYYSRSRQKLWHKGETSGHIQKVISIVSDCDNDSILMNVEQVGCACHTGNRSCFFNNYTEFYQSPNLKILKEDMEAVKDRAAHRVEGSYTNYLLDKGKEKICKKVGEEASECIIAAMKGDNDELSCEIADLTYHLLVLMECQNLNPDKVLDVLRQRRMNERRRNY